MGHREPAGLTDAEKIDWLWRARDQDNARIVGLQDENARLQRLVDQLNQQLDAARSTIQGQGYQLAALSQQANEANTRAANAVQEYIEQTQE